MPEIHCCHRSWKRCAPVASLVLAAAMTWTMTPTSAYATTLAEARNRLREIGEEFDETSRQIDETEQKLEQLKSDIELTENDIHAKEDDLRHKQDVLSTRMATEYKTGTGGLLDVIFAADNIDDLNVNLRYYMKASESDQHLITDTRNAKTDLENKRNDLNSQKDEEERVAQELHDKSDDLSRQQEEAQRLVDRLEEEERQRAIAAAQARLAAAMAARQAEMDSNGGGGDGEGGGEEGGGSEYVPPRAGAGDGSILSYAESFLGTPYVYGGMSPSGFDCSGFVGYVYSNFGWSLPRSTTGMIAWAKANGRWTSDYTQLSTGDLVFPHSGHVMIVATPSGDWSSLMTIHSPRPGRSVCYQTLYQYPIGGIIMT